MNIHTYSCVKKLYLTCLYYLFIIIDRSNFFRSLEVCIDRNFEPKTELNEDFKIFYKNIFVHL